ncbi:hypothetical protein DFH07DRAFT_776871 [Mycena maculata]|uniref:Uncharacterized protein n=1 Tax=Mycena maculata TaxID=230809 RepID=A0AAD7N470_9AGAR|nr:hypothetical protein DFH07DRAFT_776871 [Mycena maculata]
MSFLNPIDKDVVGIPPPSKHTVQNPQMRGAFPDKTESIGSSGGNTHTKAQSILRRKLVRCDQRCILSGTIRQTIQAAHLMNDIRDLRSKANRLLRSNINATLIEVHEHNQLDIYGSYMLILSPKQLSQIHLALRNANTAWEVAVAQDPTQAREIDTRSAPYAVTEIQLVILQQDAFLPQNQPILILDFSARSIMNASRPSSIVPSGNNWRTYRVDPTDCTRLIDKAISAPLPPIPFDHRDKAAGLSPFALIVNAHFKIRGLPTNHPAFVRWYHILEQLVTEIFYLPVTFQDPHRLEVLIPLSVDIPTMQDIDNMDMDF